MFCRFFFGNKKLASKKLGFKGAAAQIRDVIGSLAFVLLLLIIFVILFLEGNDNQTLNFVRKRTLDIITPVVEVISTPFDKGKEYIQDTKDYLSLKDELVKLREENEKLKNLEQKKILLL